MNQTDLRFSLSLYGGLLFLVVMAVWLRWDVFPKTYFADELIPRAVVRHMLDSGTLDTNWEHADWRGDYAGGFYNLRQYNFSSYHTVLRGVRQAVGQPVPDLVLYRVLSLLFQLLALLPVFALARRLAGVWAGCLAAAFMVVMPQAVVDAHYARPESFVILLVAVASWLAVCARLDRRHCYLLPEALVWGVAVACKFSFFPMALLAFGAWCYFLRQWWVPLCWAGGFIVGVALSAPYILLDPAGFLHGVGLLLQQYQPAPAGVGLLDSLLPSARQLFPYLQAFFGLPVLLLLLLAVRIRQPAARCFVWTALAVSAFYVLLFARQGVFFERNLSHLLPLWAVLFACGFSAVIVRLRVASRPWSQVVLVLLVLCWPTYLSTQIASYCFRDLDQVRQEIADHEQQLLRAFPGSRLHKPSVMASSAVLYELPQNALISIPQHKLPGLEQVTDILLQQGFREVDYFSLPLSFLPYNQLQINHFPPAYAYYRRVSPAGDSQP